MGRRHSTLLVANGAFLAAIACFVPLRALAGGTPVSQLRQAIGPADALADGDYVSNQNGANTYFSFFIEVPQGLGRLVIDIFDPDVGIGRGNETAANLDDQIGGSWNTATTYTLLDPSGAGRPTNFGTGDRNNPAGSNNAWTTLFNSTTNLTPGHWELRVRMSTNDDVNSFGVRAHDGDPTAGGTELNVYMPYGGYGTNAGATLDRTYTEYPYITSGCTFTNNNFDWDNSGSVQYTSRLGFTQTIAATSMSGGTVWANNLTSGFTSNSDATDYGLWTMVTDMGGPPNANTGNLYLGRFNAPGTPPSQAQLVNPANTFRLYLPTDGGGQPAKPYVIQQVRYAGVGPATPTVGQTTRLTVTITVVNPTIYPITFSATNNVTANVPGPAGQVTYAGSAVVTQGTVTAQPAIGGTGNVVWNPGSVAGGSTGANAALLVYQVNVTPAAAGTLNVTGTPTTNGTTATFIDETGDTVNVRAKYTFGPLCQLAVSTTNPTVAVVSSVKARRARNGVTLEWRTAAEAGTVAFDVYRNDTATGQNVRVRDRVVPGLLTSPAGGVYRLSDPDASPDREQTYTLVEIEAGGGRRVHGPYTVLPSTEPDPDGPLPEGGYARRRNPADMPPHATADAPSCEDRDAPRLKVEVGANGLYFIPSSDIAPAMALSPKEMESHLLNGGFELTNRGQQVAWFARDMTGLYFYGEAASGLYTKSNVYWLSQGHGVTMANVPGGKAVAPSAPQTFRASVHAEQDNLDVTALPLDPSSDYWFWDVLVAGDPTQGQKSFPITTDGVAPNATSASLVLDIQGASATGVAGEHDILVSLNGVSLGEARFEGITRRQLLFDVPSGVLRDGANTIDVTAVLAPGVAYSFLFVDSFDVSYDRTYQAAGPAFAFDAGSYPSVTVSGLSGSDVALLDITDARRPVRIAPVDRSAHAFTFAPSRPGHRYLAVSAAGLQSPARMKGRCPTSLRTREGATYLVITSAELRAEAERLAAYRGAAFPALVVDVEDAEDEFRDGLADPRAIRDLVLYALRSWRIPPRYVVLAGAGTYDYRDLLGFGGNHVPPLMIGTESGLYPSDNLFATPDGSALPLAAVGRLPVRTPDELHAAVDKVMAYDQQAPTSSLLCADRDAPGLGFREDSEYLAGLLPSGFSAERAYLSDAPIAAVRAETFAALGTGLGLMSYIGHGGIDRLAADGILTLGDVPALPPAAVSPVLAALTCTINRFGVPGYLSLGEALVTRAQGGASAVWAPSGLSENPLARQLGDGFLRGAFLSQERMRLGDAVQLSLRQFQAVGGTDEMLRVYTLFGDPALALPRPAAPPPVGGQR